MRLGRFVRLCALSLLSLLIASLMTGCGSGNAKDRDTKSGTTTITVGLLPAPPVSAPYLARERGFFKQQGIDVKFKEFTGGAAGMPLLLSGGIDILFSNSVSVMQAYAKGLPTRILMESDIAGKNQFPIMVPNGSPVKAPADLKGKKIAVNTLRNLGELAVASTLRKYGVDLKRDHVQLVEVPFPQMTNALKTRSVDAAWLLEPFVTQAEKQIAAERVVDTMTGPTARMSLGAYAATDKWISKNLAGVAAFKRAMQQAITMAVSDPKTAEQMIPKVTHGQIDLKTASTIKLTEFTPTTDANRLQHVADLSLQFGLLGKKIDARKIVA